MFSLHERPGLAQNVASLECPYIKMARTSIFSLNFSKVHESYLHMAVCQNRVPLVNIKIAGKWMFIPLKMVLIGIDPYPYQELKLVYFANLPCIFFSLFILSLQACHTRE